MTPEVTYWRQRDILSPQQMEGVSVTLIGAGGIGSPTALCLAKMGIHRMTVYDHDKIEEHNLPNQLYPQIVYRETEGYRNEGTSEYTSIGRDKVDILSQVINEWSDTQIEYKAEKYEDQPLEGIVISAVDSMSARRTIWDGVKENMYHVKLYIEARMGAEVGMVYAFNPNHIGDAVWYEKNMLYTDADSLPIPCTATAIIFNVFVLAGLIARQVKNHLTGGYLPREVVIDLVNMVMLRSEQR